MKRCRRGPESPEKLCYPAVIKGGLERMKREGGGVGQASMSVERVLNSSPTGAGIAPASVII